MVRTRSQNSQREDEHDEHITPQEPTPRALNPARPVQLRFVEQVPSTSADPSRQELILGARSAVGEQPLHDRPPSPARSTRSQRSTASTAARVKQAEYEAAERLAAIKMRQLRQQMKQQQLQIEAELVQKKLEADLAAIQDEDQGLEEAVSTNLRTEDWLRHADPSRGEPPSDFPVRETRTPLAAAPPVRPVAIASEPRHEHRGYEDRRARSPTPSRSRNRSIEALVESFERMSQYRPPPRSSTELPSFSGTENEWLPFKAAMRDSTKLHKFSPIENMLRLRNALKGPARDAVASLLYTACDPTEIMEALEQSFGRPEALIDKALEEIKQLPRLGPTTTELNVFAVKVRNIVATITNVEGLEGCLQNRMLTRNIVEKLPPHLRASFARYAAENRRPGEPHIVILSRFLNYEAAIGLEFTYSKPPAPATSNPKEPHLRSTRIEPQSTWKTQEANVFSANEEEELCLCCGGDHDPPQCRKIRDMTVDARWEWAKTNKICFKCLTKKHRRAACKAKQCGIDGCIHSHHRLLHERSPSSETSSTDTDASQEETDEVVASTSTTMKTGSKVMLKVCPVVVTNSHGVEIHTHALLDEGSTISLIEEDLANQLNLKGPVQVLNIRGISSNEREQSSRIVKLRLRGKNTRASHVIRARTVRRFHLLPQTTPLELLKYKHLQDLDPTEVCYQQARPRLLIGSDNWELIVSKELLTGGRHEPAASRTELGWVIHGSAPRTTIANKEEHVFHFRAMDGTEPALSHAPGALLHPREQDTTKDISKPKIVTSIQEKHRTNLAEGSKQGQLSLNTRGVQIAHIPLSVPVYTEIRPLRASKLGSEKCDETPEFSRKNCTNHFIQNLRRSPSSIMHRSEQVMNPKNAQSQVKVNRNYLHGRAQRSARARTDLLYNIQNRAPTKQTAKIFLRNLRRLQVGWDEHASTEIADEFSAWLQNHGRDKKTSMSPLLQYKASAIHRTSHEPEQQELKSSLSSRRRGCYAEAAQRGEMLRTGATNQARRRQ